MTKPFEEELSELIRARFPILYIQTFEEERITKILKELSISGGKFGLNRPLFLWSQTQGLRDTVDNKVDQLMRSPFLLFEHIEQTKNSALYVLLDFHIFLAERNLTTEGYQIIRCIRDLYCTLRTSNIARTIIIVSPVIELPESLQKEIIVIELPLPNQKEIRLLLERMILQNRGSGDVSIYLTESDKELLCKAALGLTLTEAEGTFARSMVNDGCLESADIDYVLAQKQQILKKSGALEYVGSDFNLNDVGGLENLKHWLARRNQTWMDSAKKYNLPPPKGVLLTGVPGCGKSLSAKAVSSLWKLPLLRFDLGSVFGMYVGESEANMRRALKSAEALAPCILWVDEIEKGLGGAAGGEGDSGTTRRVFGTFLTWMQEKTAPVFVFATANQIEHLPTELLRKGRFDEIFFVDLPDFEERKQIFEVHFRRRLTNSEVTANIQITEKILSDLASKSEGFIGAEIEQSIITALYDAFFESREFSIEDVLRAIKKTVPLSVTQSEYVNAIKQWARQRAVPAGKNYQ